ncbi:PITH domain-containing protein, partial [Mycena olivaceomarginata]
IESDTDDQMIIHIPFTGSVKLCSLLRKTSSTDQTPLKVVLFANESSLDFQDISDKTPTQEFTVAQGREVSEYTLRYSSQMSPQFCGSSPRRTDTTKVYYVGFLGLWTERKISAPVTVYEMQANLADHENIQGTNRGMSTPQF